MNVKKLCEDVLKIRLVEEKIIEVYDKDIIQCPVHLSIGEESIPVAICHWLTNKDKIVGTHRSHALYFALDGDYSSFFCELLGKKTGCSKGFGGSMHLTNLNIGLYGTSSIVGGILPIAVGLGLSCDDKEIAVAFFGDGATDQGVFYESLNFASLKNIPVLFVCENNRYSIYTPIEERKVVLPHKVAETLKIKSLYCPIEISNNVVELAKKVKDIVNYVRNKRKPAFIECETVRYLDHHGTGCDIERGCRPVKEKELFEKYDPIKWCKKYLNEFENLREKLKKEIDSAFEQAIKEENFDLWKIGK
ncbi:MAG TPA: thiamine pyrophosphate-dependent dehydrogenase E1 component subunit alpha [Candidatus Desulfofervidus auxilii]|uniref:Thiamine pyrophosphate-dependent dehydrogenase E1 component subunit alpha n=1 Tax=Desulfofervidus auxilii TaxID=1621989 RepID=A0A7C0Y336_DESA2|nr:thiamine pyrophosphate-dependent dehydrogenase E1 component subunit alpha [Candidatus Desulfofervidus auxilii]